MINISKTGNFQIKKKNPFAKPKFQKINIREILQTKSYKIHLY